MTSSVGVAADMVTVWIARRVPPAVWNSTGLPVSPWAGATCFSPTSFLATRIAASTLRPARSAAGACSPGTGEPVTLMSRPSLVTLASRPLPNSGTPPTCWTKARWWMPSMST